MPQNECVCVGAGVQTQTEKEKKRKGALERDHCYLRKHNTISWFKKCPSY